MPLESALYISDLNVGNPASTDSVAQADDHIRLIKAAIKATFPNVSGPVTSNQSELNNFVPAGVIVMWSGEVAPAGWSLCDGTNGTPDLRNRFVVSTGSSYNLNQTGGSFTSDFAGGHTHTATSAGSHTHSGSTGGTALTLAEIPSHSHTWDGLSTSEDNNFTAGTRFLREGSTVNSASFTVTTSTAGNGATHNHSISSDGSHNHTIGSVNDHTHFINPPPYYALAYIMKI